VVVVAVPARLLLPGVDVEAVVVEMQCPIAIVCGFVSMLRVDGDVRASYALLNAIV
jgi:hypothetical protein